jgi:hypothetical protein
MLGLALVLAGAVNGCGGNWKEFSSAEGKYKVMMPGTPKETTQASPAGPIKFHTVEEKNGAYVVNFTDITGTASEPPEKIDQRLDGARQGAAGNVQGKVVKEDKITLEGKYPGRDIQIELPNDKGLIRVRMYFVNGRLYQVMAVGTKSWTGSGDVQKFLDSFALLQ